MPDGRLAAPKHIGELAKQKPRELALKTARDIERACGRVEVPERPFELAHLTRQAVAALRKDQEPATVTMLASWDAWRVAYSSAIAENKARIRGLLWVWRLLSDVAERNPADREVADFLAMTRTFLREEWRVENPPTDRVECAALAERVAESIARVDVERTD